MPRLMLTIEYDGTGFLGWQSQSGGGTVQDEIERAILEVTGEKIRIDGSGRTDAGVHALGQVATFDSDSTIPPDNFAAALNRELPDTITVLESRAVDGEFHARYSAKGKTYRYVIVNRPARASLDRDRAAYMRGPLDADAMSDAAGAFVGEHDFRAFACETEADKDCVRTITRCDVARHGDRITIEVEGSGFLRKMVRTIVGTLIEAGRGKMSPGDVAAVIESRDRKIAGRTAPPQGLYLVEVKY